MSDGTTMYCGDNCNHTGPHRYPPRDALPATPPASETVEAEWDEEQWRAAIERHLGSQRLSQYMRRDIEMMARGALLGAAIRAEADEREEHCCGDMEHMSDAYRAAIGLPPRERSGE